MRKLTRLSVALLALAAGASGVRAQGMPTSQPSILSIFIEEVQVGMDADHAANEAGWPAAYAMTGSSEVWFLAPYASWTQEGENMKQTDADPELSAELARLWRADGQYLTSARTVQAVARPDLSYGAFPNLGLVRFYEITTFRVRPGHEEGFEAAVKMYTEVLTRASSGASFRTYSVVAGMPSPTYLVFASVNAYGEFDKMMADGMAMWQSLTPEQMTEMGDAMRNDVINVITHRFRVDPRMSYVAPDAKAADPAFWGPQH
jgi:hypothetical protein